MPSPDYEQMDQKMNDFHGSFKQAMQSYRNHLSELKSQFSEAVQGLIIEQNNIKDQMLELSEKEKKVKSTLDRELETLETTRALVEELQANKQALEENKQSLLDKIAVLDREISQKKDEINNSKKSLHQNLHKDMASVKLYERFLGLKIDGVSTDVIKFIFTNLIPSNPDRTFEIVLDLSDPDGQYRIARVSDLVAEKELGLALRRLNMDRSLVGFLKEVRALFCASVES